MKKNNSDKNANMTINCQNIYNKFSREYQKEICGLLGKYFEMRPDSIQNNWFNGFKIIPKGKLLDTFKILVSFEITKNTLYEK